MLDLSAALRAEKLVGMGESMEFEREMELVVEQINISLKIRKVRIVSI